METTSLSPTGGQISDPIRMIAPTNQETTARPYCKICFEPPVRTQIFLSVTDVLFRLEPSSDVPMQGYATWWLGSKSLGNPGRKENIRIQTNLPSECGYLLTWSNQIIMITYSPSFILYRQSAATARNPAARKLSKMFLEHILCLAKVDGTHSAKHYTRVKWVTLDP